MDAAIIDADPGRVDASDAPQPDAPASDAPASDAPRIDAPAPDAPLTDAPTTDAPLSDAPATDAPAADAPLIDGPPTDAPAIDAAPDACAVLGGFPVHTATGQLLDLDAVRTPDGWFVVASLGGRAWWTRVSFAGAVLAGPTVVVNSTTSVARVTVAASADRVLVGYAAGSGWSLQTYTSAGAAVGAPRVALAPLGTLRLAAGPGDGFRAVWTAVVPAMFPLRPTQSDLRIDQLDRDGATTVTGAVSRLSVLEVAAVKTQPDQTLAMAVRSYHAIGGCRACTSDGVVRGELDGTFTDLGRVLVTDTTGATTQSMSAAATPSYLTYEMRTDVAPYEGAIVRWPLEVRAAIAGATRLAIATTSPRQGLVAGQDGSGRWLRRFDDTASFTWGARCTLDVTPSLIEHDPASGHTLVLGDDGAARVVTAP